MMDFLKTYKTRPWPKLELPPVRKPQLFALILFTIGIIAAGWYIWFFAGIRAEKFLYIGLVIPILLFLKSRWVTIVGLLCFQVILAFIFIGNSDYALIAVAVLVGAIIAFESPIIMYMILIGAVWFDMSPLMTTRTLRAEFIIGIALLVGWVFRNILSSQNVLYKLYFREKWYAILFLIWVAVGFALWSYEPIPLGWAQLKWIIVGIIFFLITPLIIRDERQLDLIIYAWIVVGMIAVSSIVVAPIVGFQQEATTWGAAPAAMGVQKNMSASFMSLSFFLVLAYFHWTRGFLRKFFITLCMLAIFSATLYQQSRSASVSLVVGFIIFWLADSFLVKRKRSPLRLIWRIFLLGSIGAILLISIYFLGLGVMIGSYAELFQTPTEMSTSEVREILWSTSFEIIENENHQIRGLGTGAFWILGPEYGLGSLIGVEDDPEDFVKQGIHPHNLYIDILLHYGVIGIGLFLLLSFIVLLKLWLGFLKFQNLKYQYICLGLFCGLIAFYFHCIFDFTIFLVNRYWLYIGLAVAAISVGRNLKMSSQDNH